MILLHKIAHLASNKNHSLTYVSTICHIMLLYIHIMTLCFYIMSLFWHYVAMFLLYAIMFLYNVIIFYIMSLFLHYLLLCFNCFYIVVQFDQLGFFYWRDLLCSFAMLIFLDMPFIWENMNNMSFRNYILKKQGKVGN